VRNFVAVGSWVSILWGVKFRHLPFTWAVAINTVLALPRSLWYRCTSFSRWTRGPNTNLLGAYTRLVCQLTRKEGTPAFGLLHQLAIVFQFHDWQLHSRFPKPNQNSHRNLTSRLWHKHKHEHQPVASSHEHQPTTSSKPDTTSYGASTDRCSHLLSKQ